MQSCWDDTLVVAVNWLIAHVLVFNAAVIAGPLSYTRHGCKSQIGTNHFGHLLMFKLLEAKLAS